jgi:hypothetical protein
MQITLLRHGKPAVELASMARSKDLAAIVRGSTGRPRSDELPDCQQLLANGWCGPIKPGKRFWEYGVYGCGAVRAGLSEKVKC